MRERDSYLLTKFADIANKLLDAGYLVDELVEKVDIDREIKQWSGAVVAYDRNVSLTLKLTRWETNANGSR